MNLDLSSGSPEETFLYGESLGRILKGRELIFLSGNLGAGKTMFTKGIGSGLGIERREIVSPSYTLMNIYEGRHKLFHIDLYRIGADLAEGVPEIDDNLDTGVIVVEWAEFIKKHYAEEKTLIEISILYTGEGTSGRKLSVSSGLNIPPGIFHLN